MITAHEDPAIQTAVDRESVLGDQSTLCRLGNRTDRKRLCVFISLSWISLFCHLGYLLKNLILILTPPLDKKHGRKCNQLRKSKTQNSQGKIEPQG